MKRGRIGLLSVFVLLPVLLFVGFVWLNWGPAELAGGERGPVHLHLGGDRAIDADLSELLPTIFCLGLLLGVAGAVVNFLGARGAMRERIESLEHDKRKLAAANRALEAALPVLRERYDAAIGGLDPTGNVLNEPLGDEAEHVSIQQLALEDAAAKQEARRRRGRS